MRAPLAILVVLLMSGCGAPEPPPRESPAALRGADPCTFVAQPVAAANGLRQTSADTSRTSRGCSWTSGAFSATVLIRWDPEPLADFSTAFPVLAGADVDLEGRKATLGKSGVRPACGAIFPADAGVAVEIIAGNAPPSTADAACERVKTLGEAAVREIRRQRLLKQ